MSSPCPLPLPPKHTHHSHPKSIQAQPSQPAGNCAGAAASRRAAGLSPGCSPVPTQGVVLSNISAALNSLNRQAEFRECADIPDLKYLPLPGPSAGRSGGGSARPHASTGMCALPCPASRDSSCPSLQGALPPTGCSMEPGNPGTAQLGKDRKALRVPPCPDQVPPTSRDSYSDF